jgi:hypothetical protein
MNRFYRIGAAITLFLLAVGIIPGLLLAQGAVTRNMEPYGSQQSSIIPISNLKVGKVFKLGEKRTLEFNYQLFNAFNSSAAITTIYLTGTTYGRVSSIVDPRVSRISMRFEF